MKDTRKLTARVLDSLGNGSEGEIWDTELSGYHVRVGKRGISFRVSFYNDLGKRRVVTLGRYGPLKASEARELAKQTLASIAQGVDVRQVESDRKASKLTVRDYLNGPYMEHQNRKKDGKGTLRRIEKDFEGWLDEPMASLTRSDVEKWQAKEESKDKPRAFGTLKRSFDSLQAMLSHAVEREVIAVNPLSGVKLQKPSLSEEELIKHSVSRRYLEKNDVERLFRGLEQYRIKRIEERERSIQHGRKYLPSFTDVRYVDHVEPFILLMYYTGFRPGDLYGLRWEHVDFKHKQIRKIIEKTAHHNDKPSVFPLSSKALEVLEQWNEQKGNTTQGYVFPSNITGERLSNTALRRPWELVKKLGGLDDGLNMYTLRHNFASQLVMAGVDLLTVSKLMSHTDIQTTIEHYAHLSPDHSRNAVEVICK